jgi:dolichyl-phosphate beta-glucosyltransferase
LVFKEITEDATGSKLLGALPEGVMMSDFQLAANLPFVVVPCFNEEKRLNTDAFIQFARTKQINLVFVNDGSSDGTLEILRMIQESSLFVIVETLTSNVGKGEAVRHGLNVAVSRGAEIVGYFDADLATPISELIRLINEIEENPTLNGVFGSRIARLGAQIDRNPFRHYVGRIYGTLAASALGFEIYDTQCGAKVFRISETFREAISKPFRSHWSFDVVLLDRIINTSNPSPRLSVDSFLELPLKQWRDVEGSTVRVRSALSAFADLVRIRVRRHLIVRKYAHNQRNRDLAS